MIKKGKIKRILLIDCFVLAAVVSMFVTLKLQKRDAFTYKGEYKSLSLEGKWYKVDMDTITVVDMTNEGEYIEKDINGEQIKKADYMIGNHALKINNAIYSMNYVDEAAELKNKEDIEDISEYELRKYFYITDDNQNRVYYFSKEESAADQVEDNCSTNSYFEETELFDENGFAIDGDGCLLAYTGDEKEVIIPPEVVEIEENAMSSDYERALNTDKVTIPSTVKRIVSGAFSFSNIKKVYIKQGVETIDSWAFGDSNIEEIHFPDSIANLSPKMLDTEEGLSGLKIYCKKDSQTDKYFKTYPLDGQYQIIYE